MVATPETFKNMPSASRFTGAAAETATATIAVVGPPNPDQSGGPLFRRRRPRLLNSVFNESPGIFSPAEIASANLRHDQHYGFTFAFPTTYANLLRFPESVLGKLPWDDNIGEEFC